MKRQVLYTSVKNNRLLNGEMFLKMLLPHEGKDICVSVERKRKKRSLNENSFMHGPFLDSFWEMLAHYGHDVTREMAKDILKRQFGPKRTIALPDGSEEVVDVSTADYSTVQMEGMMEEARRYYAEYWQLPYPNEDRYGQPD